MNRENKRKQFEKDTIKHMGVVTALPVRYAAGLVVPTGAGSNHGNHCPNCLSSLPFGY